jgi:hypothetical protein
MADVESKLGRDIFTSRRRATEAARLRRQATVCVPKTPSVLI